MLPVSTSFRFPEQGWENEAGHAGEREVTQNVYIYPELSMTIQSGIGQRKALNMARSARRDLPYLSKMSQLPLRHQLAPV